MMVYDVYISIIEVCDFDPIHSYLCETVPLTEPSEQAFLM